MIKEIRSMVEAFRDWAKNKFQPKGEYAVRTEIPTLTKSLLATEEGTALDAIVGPIIDSKFAALEENIISQNENFTNSLSQLNSDLKLQKAIEIENEYLNIILYRTCGICRVFLSKVKQNIEAGQSIDFILPEDFAPKWHHSEMLKFGRSGISVYVAISSSTRQFGITFYEGVSAGNNLYGYVSYIKSL